MRNGRGSEVGKRKKSQHFGCKAQLLNPICTSLIKLTCSCTVALQYPTAAVRQALCAPYWFCFCRPCPCGSKWQRTVVVPPRPDTGTTPWTSQDPQRRTESPSAQRDMEGIQTWGMEDNVCFNIKQYGAKYQVILWYYKCLIKCFYLFTLCKGVFPLMVSRVKVKAADFFSWGKYFSASLLIERVKNEHFFDSTDIGWY